MPFFDGANPAAMSHEAPIARLAGHEWDATKSVNAAIEAMLSAALPVLVSVTCCNADVVPTS